MRKSFHDPAFVGDFNIECFNYNCKYIYNIVSIYLYINKYFYHKYFIFFFV